MNTLPLYPSSAKRCAGAIIGALLICVTAGCGKDHAENQGTDNAYIRAPGEATEKVDMPTGDLLPGKVGDSWTWNVTTIRRVLENNEVRSDTVSKEVEEAVFAGNRVVNGVTTRVFETRKKGKPFREEIYSVTDKGVLQVSAGLADKVVMTPLFPIMSFPIKEGQGQSWDGVLKYKNMATAGSGYSRVSGQEMVKTPKGDMPAWRVDSVITAKIAGQPEAFPVSRWFSPGIGMVRQRLYVRNLVVQKELQTFQVSK